MGKTKKKIPGKTDTINAMGIPRCQMKVLLSDHAKQKLLLCIFRNGGVASLFCDTNANILFKR